MIYLLKTELKKNKKVVFALNKIYGLGRSQSIIWCKKLGISSNLKVAELSVEQIIKLEKLLENTHQPLANNLKNLRILTFKKLVSLKTYKGLRRFRGLPARGQRTHTNAKTAKLIK